MAQLQIHSPYEKAFPYETIQLVGEAAVFYASVLAVNSVHNGNNLLVADAFFVSKLMVAAEGVNSVFGFDNAVQDICTVITLIKGNVPLFQHPIWLYQHHRIKALTKQWEHTYPFWIKAELPTAIKNNAYCFVIFAEGKLLSVIQANQLL